MTGHADITGLLHKAHEGDSDALNEVIPVVYEELKKLASSQLRRESSAAGRYGQALQTTVLVHEAFLRLSLSKLPDCENRSHFYGIAARIMRQVLVDTARARHAEKRGPGQECSFAELPEVGTPDDSAFLALDQALHKLATESALKAQLLELRFFCGLTAEETAEALSIPVHVVRRELRLARAWLVGQLG